MFCSTCGAQSGAGKFCGSCGAAVVAAGGGAAAVAAPRMVAPTVPSGADVAALPPGVAGFSWGALLLNWIWAIGNSVWIGLLALVPYVGFVVAIYLGFKGRELAWKAKKWESVEEFDRVQKKWSKWAVGLTLAALVIGVLVAIAVGAAASR